MHRHNLQAPFCNSAPKELTRIYREIPFPNSKVRYSPSFPSGDVSSIICLHSLTLAYSDYPVLQFPHRQISSVVISHVSSSFSISCSFHSFLSFLALSLLPSAVFDEIQVTSYVEIRYYSAPWMQHLGYTPMAHFASLVISSPCSTTNFLLIFQFFYECLVYPFSQICAMPLHKHLTKRDWIQTVTHILIHVIERNCEREHLGVSTEYCSFLHYKVLNASDSICSPMSYMLWRQTQFKNVGFCVSEYCTAVVFSYR